MLGNPPGRELSHAVRVEDEMTRTISTETPPSVTSTSETNTTDGNAPQRRNSFPIIAKVGIVAAIVLAGYFIWNNFVAPPKIPRSIVTLSGRIEGDDSAVSPKTAGRILEIRVREGDTVKAGDTIAVLDDAQMRAREDQARAALTGAEARAKSASDQIAVFSSNCSRTICRRNNRKWMRAAACGRRRRTWPPRNRTWRSRKPPSSSPSSIRRLSKAGQDRRGFGTPGQAGHATADQQAAAVAAARRRLEAARGMLTTAQANLSNPGIREFQAATVRKQIAQQQRRSLRQGVGAAGAVPTGGSGGDSQRSDRHGALRRHGDDARGRAGRSGAGGHRDRDAARYEQSLSARFRAGRTDRQSEDRPAGAIYLDSAPQNRSTRTSSASIRRPRSRPKTPTSATIA